MRRAVLKLSTWACIAVVVAVLIAFICLMSRHKILFTPEVFGYINLKNSGHTKGCISVSMNCKGKDLGPIAVDDDGRFHVSPMEDFDFDRPGDRVTISCIEIRVCNGTTVDYEMFLIGAEFDPDRTPKAYLIHVDFSGSGNPILRAVSIDGRIRDAIGKTEFQKYVDKFSDLREFEKYTQWNFRFEESVGDPDESP